MKSVRVRIEGRVQGVWYRRWTQEKAVARGLDGWIRNLHDGAVEALFSGPDGMVDDMIALCRKGPIAARVDAVTVTPADAPSETGFQVLPTE